MNANRWRQTIRQQMVNENPNTSTYAMWGNIKHLNALFVTNII